MTRMVRTDIDQKRMKAKRTWMHVRCCHPDLCRLILIPYQNTHIANHAQPELKFETISNLLLKPPTFFWCGRLIRNYPGFELVIRVSDGSVVIGGVEVVRLEPWSRWLGGFSKKIGLATAYKAKLWRILTGLQLAWNLDIIRLIMECDSLSIITLLNSHEDSRCPRNLNGLISHIQLLRGKDWEGNMCADQSDHLANSTLHLDFGCHTVDRPDLTLRRFLSQYYRKCAL
ncbi:hypothetical protein RIF29_22408 [Crotalaria pallida]|uniref:RNase H type-1 domain-containing protein n=1 Tax=Crotalaria pallida TaxID=3830 RepID=A0AAN9F6J3_CROPI